VTRCVEASRARRSHRMWIAMRLLPAGGRVHANRRHDITLNEQCFCAAKVLSRPCLSWVKDGSDGPQIRLPLLPQQRTCGDCIGKSEKCQQRTTLPNERISRLLNRRFLPREGGNYDNRSQNCGPVFAWTSRTSGNRTAWKDIETAVGRHLGSSHVRGDDAGWKKIFPIW